MTYYSRFFITIILIAVGLSLSAQPNWTVNPSDFQYTMTMAGVALFQCEESVDENDIVAAFINGEVRGVQQFNTEFQGRHYAYMIAYDNDYDGNEIIFKLYDASEDQIFDVLNTAIFEENGNIGTTSDPFEFNTVYSIENILLSTDTIPENAVANDIVADIVGINELQDTMQSVYNFIDDQLGIDNSYFSIFGDQLVLTEDVDINLKTSYQIHINGIDENGCEKDASFLLNVSNGGVMSVFDNLMYSINHTNIYPNPSQGMLNYFSNKKIDLINIFDLQGRLIYSKNINNTQSSIDISFLNNGIYLVTLSSNKINFIKKIVVCK